jgi:hypothetical protein
LVNTYNKIWKTIDVDVLVAGGGPAGLGAALGAAGQGAKTLLVERMGFLGGIGSIGLGMTINAMRPDGHPRGKAHEALIDRLTRFGDIAYRYEQFGLVDWTYIINTDYLKLAAFQALEDAGCDYLLHTFVSDAIVEQDTVTGAIVATKSGPLQINARCVVDSTGDGDLAYFAGCHTEKGRETDGFLSPMTSLFVIGGVDIPKIIEYQQVTPRFGLSQLETMDGGWRKFLNEMRQDGFAVPERMHMKPAVYPGSVYVNHAGTSLFGKFDGTDVFDLTRAERLMRQMAIDIIHRLKDKHIPGFEEAFLEQTSAWTGVRETRRIIGDYILTEADVLNGTRFPDAVATRIGVLDIGFVRTEKMPPHDVPYRALLSKNINNIFSSGRNISTDHVAMSAGKSMGNCMATGHAAGVAAALCATRHTTAHQLDPKLVQRALIADGVPLEV